jgi:hypothetical protein
MAGERGLTGKAGVAGATGRPGARGAKGSTGSTGSQGRVVTSPGRRRLIAAVDRHIENIYSELTVQMKRMAKIQAQIDELRERVRRAL